MLDDASAENCYSADEYIARSHARSVLCLPLIKQGRLTGVLYLENNLASHVFTPARIAVLKLLASQAATSLENAQLYADLRVSENRLRLAIDTIPAVVASATPDGSPDFFNKRWLEYTGVTSDSSVGDQWEAVIHPDDLPRMLEVWSRAQATGEAYESEARVRRADGVLGSIAGSCTARCRSATSRAPSSSGMWQRTTSMISGGRKKRRDRTNASSDYLSISFPR